jgi:phage terminase large subunit-like protein
VTDNPWVKKEPTTLQDGRIWYGPHPKQQQFLLHAHTREVFYGGAGGGGKSQALWYGALQFVDVPGYAALILRRTYADLSKPGALMDRARTYLAGTGAVWNERDKRWSFPSGASITFGYLQNEGDKYQYASAEFQYIAFDELTHFSETQYTFLFTRLRKTRGALEGVPLRMRGASNPGAVGHFWVKNRFVDPKTREAKRVFIPATMDDNPSLDREEYRESLSNTDALTRAKIERGDWDAVEGGRFRREWFGRWRRDPHSPDFVLAWPGAGIDEEPERFQWRGRPIFQTCDPAASASTAADYFVLSTWLLSPKGRLLWWDCERGKFELPEQVSLCQRSYARHKPQFVCVEEVLNQRGLAQLLRRSTTPAMVVRGVSPNGKKKLEHALGAIVLASDGRLLLPEDSPLFPLEDVVAELTRFTGDDTQDANDDCVDCASYACEVLPMLGPPNGGRAPGMYLPKALR